MRRYYPATRRLIHWCVIPCIAIIIILWPTYSSGLTLLQTDPGDTMLNLYFLEHSYNHFTSLNIFNPELFWSPDYYWPVRGVFAWSDHMIGPSLLYGLFRSTFNQFQSYVGWLSLTLFLNYISFRRALIKISPITQGLWLSLISISIIFSNTITEQLDHPQLLSLFWAGPILVQCDKLICGKISDLSLSDLAITAIFLLLNGFFNIYIFVYLLYGVECSILIHLIRRIRLKNWIIQIGRDFKIKCGLLLGIIGLNYIVYKEYLEAMKLFGKRSQEEILSNLPKFQSWLFGASDWLVKPPLNPDNYDSSLIGGVEQELFPGWTFIFLISISLVTLLIAKIRSCNRKALTWLVLAIILVVGSISIKGYSLWPMISNLLPGSNSLRASSRVSLIIVIFTGPFIATSAANWRTYGGNFCKQIIEIILILSGLFSLIRTKAHSFSLIDWRNTVNSYQNILEKKECDLFWLEWSKDSPPWIAHIQAMHLQQRTKIPTINGHSGQAPINKWPFDNSSGLIAYNWLMYSDISTSHLVKSELLPSKSCILKTTSKAGGNVQNELVNPKSLYLASWIIKNESLVLDINQNGYLVLRSMQKNGLWSPPIKLKDEMKNSINGNLHLITYSALSKHGNLVFLQSLHHEYPYKKEVSIFKISQNEAFRQAVNHEYTISTIDKQEMSRLQNAHNLSKPKVVFEEANLSVYKLRNGELLLKETKANSKSNFVLLKKHGQGIKSERGGYAISGLKADNENFYVRDTNSLQSASYLWSINRKTGEVTEEHLLKAEQMNKNPISRNK